MATATEPSKDPSSPLSEEQFASIVAPLIPALRDVARKILRSDDLAGDAVQEAALSLWLETNAPPNPPAWLFRAVVNRSLHLARSRARRRKHEARACYERPEYSERDNPCRPLEGRDLLDRLLEILAELPQDHHQLLTLRSLHEMDYKSIARTLDIPVGTVRSRLNRSRAALRDAVKMSLPEEHENRFRSEPPAR